MNANLKKAIEQTLREIQAEDLGNAAAMITRLARNFCVAEHKEKTFQRAMEEGDLAGYIEKKRQERNG